MKFKTLYIVIFIGILLASCSKVQDDTFKTIESSPFLSNEIIPNLLTFTYFNNQQNETDRSFISNDTYVVPLQYVPFSITWNAPASGETSIQGYKIYRKELSASSWNEIATIEKENGIINKYYQDAPSTPNIVYSYSITSILNTGEESEKSISQNVTIIDSVRPEAPQNLRITLSNNTAILNWDRSSSPDVIGYYVYVSDTYTNNKDLIKLDTGLISPSNLSYTHPNLNANIPYTFAVKAKDLGNLESNFSTTVNITLDQLGPELSFLQYPSALSNSDVARFELQSNEALTSCFYSYNNGSESTCSLSAPILLSNLAQGQHNITVRASDSSLNERTIIYNWRTEYDTPTLILTTTSNAVTNLRTARFALESNQNQISFSYSLNGSSFTTFSSPLDLVGLGNGNHEIIFKVENQFSNSSTTTFNWEVDTTPAVIEITLTKPNILNKNYNARVITSTSESNVSLTYSLNDSSFEGFVSNPQFFHSIEGANSIEIKSIDAVGNESLQAFDWDIDTYDYSLETRGSGINYTFSQPNQVMEDATGRIYVVDSLRHRVQVFSAAKNHLFTLGITDQTSTENVSEFLKYPTDIEIDESGKIYVVDQLHHRVQKFNSEGEYIDSIGQSFKSGSSNDHFNSPSGIGYDSNRLYIADLGNNRIKVYRTSGDFLGSITAANGVTFLSPVDVTAKDNKIYILDQARHCVYIFNDSLTHIGTLGEEDTPGTSYNHFNSPSKIQINDDDEIIVSDTSNHRVLVFDINLNFKYVMGTTRESGNSSHLLNSPTGIYSTGSGKLYISNKGSNKINVYNR